MIRKAKNVLNFTEKTIRGLALDDGKPMVRYYDKKCEGLAIENRKTGKRFFYMKRRGKDTTPIKIGNWPRWSVERAREEAARIDARWLDEVNPAEERRKDKAALTLSELFEKYIKQDTRGRKKKPRSNKTTKDYRFNFDRHIAPRFGHVAITKLTRKEVADWHGTIKAKYMANRCLALLRALLNDAMDNELLERNVASKVTPHAEESRRRHLSDEEISAFWQACGKQSSGDYWKVCLMELYPKVVDELS